jgi:Phage integrase, N-terminal SAM-like domain
MAPPNLSDKSTTAKPPKLLDQVRDKLRVKHYSIRTEQTYVDWIKRYIFFHDKRHPKNMEARDVEAFFTHDAGAARPLGCSHHDDLNTHLESWRQKCGQSARQVVAS